MFKIKIPHLIIMVCCLHACETIPLDTVDDEPVFKIDFVANGQEYAFAAGIDGYSMETSLLFQVQGLPIPFYLGELLPLDGDIPIEGKPRIDFAFQVNEQVNNAIEPDHLNSFQVGQLPYRTVDDALLPVTEVILNADYNGTGSEAVYNWDYGDGGSVAFENPIHAYPTTGEYLTSVFVEDNNQCIASASNTVSFDGRGDCEASIDVINVSNASAILESNSNGVAPFTYVWSTGETTEDISLAVMSSPTAQQYCVTITDANNCESVNCIGLVYNGSGDVNHCSVEMEETNYPRARGAIQFSGLEFRFIDENGDEFNTREVLQGPGSFFEVTSVEEYEPNANGERTVKLDFDFACVFYLTLGTDPISATGSGTIAVAIP